MSATPIRLRLAVAPAYHGHPFLVDAWPVTDDDAQGLALCVHPAIDGNGWTVSCARTGMRLSSDQDREAAVHQALCYIHDAAAQHDMASSAWLDQRRREWLDALGAERLGGEVGA